MSYSSLTHQYRPSWLQRSPRQGTVVDTILWHHQAGTNDDMVINAMISGSRRVSSNYTISNEGRITCVVDEEDRAWTSGSTTDGGKGATWDRRAITVEIENETGAPNWQISEAAIKAAAALRADIRRRYGIMYEFGHRELFERFRASYPTYCPGPTTVARIAGTVSHVPVTPAQPGPGAPVSGGKVDYQYGLSSAAVRAVQSGLARLGRYSGDIDGIAGPMTVSGVQQWLKDHGALPATYKVDGIPGPIYMRALQTVARGFGYTGPVDGVAGPNTSGAVERWGKSLGAVVITKPVTREGADWSWWEPSGELAKRVQRALKARGRYDGPVDGVFGPNTRKGVQISLAQSGLHAGDRDGTMERDEAYGLQEYARRFGSYTGPKDGHPREQSWKGFALGLERP